MIKQQTFASAEWNQKAGVTRRERLLAEIDAVIPCSLWLTATRAAKSELGQIPHLLHGDESALYGDETY